MKNVFPIWWCILAAVVALSYAGFAVYITHGAWDVIRGEVDNLPLLVFWVFGLVGGGFAAVACIVFAHAFGVMLPYSMDRIMAPPPPPPPFKREEFGK